MIMKKFLIFLLLCCSLFGSSYGFNTCDSISYRIYFDTGSSSLDLSFRNNASCIDSLLSSIRSLQKRSILRRISLSSGASPEGNSSLNHILSNKRGINLRSYIQKHSSLADSLFTFSSCGQDWDGLLSLVEKSHMPDRNEVLHILRETPEWVVRNGIVVDSRKRQLMMLSGGNAWRYMEENFFPELRSFVVKCEFDSIYKRTGLVDKTAKTQVTDTIILHDTIKTVMIIRDTVYLTPATNVHKPFYMALKNNMLYDVLLIPNIGIEFYLGKGWSIGGNWIYAWWEIDRKHYYWRTYGGELNIRKYFNYCTWEKPFTGHHLGFYGQMLTYDFELGGRGYLGNRWSYGAGLEYGYSFPVCQRLNIDLSIGFGYLGGKYKVYDPIDSHYVWKETKQRHWFGPTKAEISLAWLLGRSHFKDQKGEAQ